MSNAPGLVLAASVMLIGKRAASASIAAPYGARRRARNVNATQVSSSAILAAYRPSRGEPPNTLAASMPIA